MKFKIPQKYSLSNLLFNKKFTIVLSIVLAFSLWLGIAMVDNPVRSQTFSDMSATITLDGTSASDLGLGIVSDVTSQRYSITVSGPNYIVSALKAEDFSLYASTVDVNTAGKHNLKISAKNNSNKTGFTITSITPSSIDVNVDFIDTKEFTVVPKLIGVSASEGLVAETPIVSDSQQSTITVKGPRTVMEKIASVGTFAEVNNTLSASQIFNADVVLYDSNDKIIYRFAADGTVYDANQNVITNSYLTLSFNNVKVTQPISKKKVVECKPVFNNLPAGVSLDTLKYTLSQKNVTVIGTPEIIDKIENISLSPIDFRDVGKDKGQFDVSPILPDGVRILEKIDVFKVEINTSNFVDKELSVKNIRFLGTGGTLKAKTELQSIVVKVCGPTDVIKKLKASDLYLVVDLTDKSAGEHTVEAVVKSDIYDNIWQRATYDISVTLYE